MSVTCVTMEEEFDRSLVDFSVVMLCGTTFSGKTAIYRKHFSATHERFSATELFSKMPECGLRYAAGCVVQLLQKNKKVVIDDDNLSRQVREGYILQIQNKVPDIQVACLKVTPRLGESQIHWSAQTRLAEKVLRGEDKATTGHRKWWNASFEEPGSGDGFDKVSSVTTSLEYSTPYKFEVPCLFMEFAALLNEEGHLATGIVEALRMWTTTYPHGRLCVMQKVDDSLSEDQVVALVNRLSTQVPSTPFYLLLSNHDRCRTNIDPLMADMMLLHRLHLCDFQHKGSLYCGTLTDSNHVLKSCALKCLKAKLLLKDPTVITSIGQPCNVTLPDVLRYVVFTSGDDDLLPTIPFFSRVTPCNLVFQCTVDQYRRIFLICSSYQSLERYNALYASSCSKHNEPSKFAQTCGAMRTTLPASRNAGARKRLPTWMLPVSERPEHQENSKKTRVKNQESSRTSSDSDLKRKEKTAKRSKTGAKYEGLPKNRIVRVHKRRRVQRLEFVSSDSDSGSKFDDFNKTTHQMSTKSKRFEKDNHKVQSETTMDSASDLSYNSDDDIQLIVGKSPVYTKAGFKKFSSKHTDLQTSSEVPNSSGPCSSTPPSVLDDMFCERVKKRPPPKKQRVVATDVSSVLDLGKSPSPPSCSWTGGGKKTIETDHSHGSSSLLDLDSEDCDYGSGFGASGKIVSPENEKKRRQALEALRALDEIF